MVGRSQGNARTHGSFQKGKTEALKRSSRSGVFPLRYFLLKGVSMEISEIIALYVECIRIALPFTIVWYLCDFIVTSFLRVAFGGRLDFRSF